MATLGAIMLAAIAVNTWYFDVHDQHNDVRYVQKGDFYLAQASFADTSVKLDMLVEQISSLQVQSAVTVVGSFQQEYDRHMRDQEQTIVWEVERDRLKRQLDRAIAYRDCLMAERSTCEQLRGW